MISMVFSRVDILECSTKVPRVDTGILQAQLKVSHFAKINELMKNNHSAQKYFLLLIQIRRTGKFIKIHDFSGFLGSHLDLRIFLLN
jgi:hypothetical protein